MNDPQVRKFELDKYKELSNLEAEIRKYQLQNELLRNQIEEIKDSYYRRFDVFGGSKKFMLIALDNTIEDKRKELLIHESKTEQCRIDIQRLENKENFSEMQKW